ncbi:MAG: twin-arginine translocation signal domain-containing protein, partial [Anaerolineae bacterium]
MSAENVRLTRRNLLKLVGAAAATATLGACGATA